MHYIKITLEEVEGVEEFDGFFEAAATVRVQVFDLPKEVLPSMLLTAYISLTEKMQKQHGDCQNPKCPFIRFYLPLAKEMQAMNTQMESEMRGIKQLPEPKKLYE